MHIILYSNKYFSCGSTKHLPVYYSLHIPLAKTAQKVWASLWQLPKGKLEQAVLKGIGKTLNSY